MPENSPDDDGQPRPRHRKNGRASKRGRGSTGRHLRVAPEQDAGSSAPGVYPVENLVAMSASALELLLHRARIEAASITAAVPHVLITRDTETGVLTRSDPFRTGLEALRAGTDFVDKYRGLEPRWDFTLAVAPLTPEE